MRTLAIVTVLASSALLAAFGCSASDSPNAYVADPPAATEPPVDEPATGSSSGKSASSSSTSSTSSGGSSGTSSTSSSGSSSGSTSSSSGTVPDEFDAPEACTNGMSTAGNGANMQPGKACNSCHNFTLAGTVYPTAHEPNNCKGVNVSGTKIVITDAANKTFNLTVNTAGNFFGNGNITAPYKVKVVTAAGKERAMTTSLTAAMGDCDSCHTQNGSGSPAAPGRILMPK